MSNYTRKCDICGERHDTVTLTTHDGAQYTVCEKCASTFFRRSCVSGTWVLYDKYRASISGVRDSYDLTTWARRLNHLGLFMLAEEWRYGRRFCGKCGLPSFGLADVSDEGKRISVCDDCFDEYYSAYSQCTDCGVYFDPEYDEGEDDRNGEYVCSVCIEENYVHCDECGRLFHRDDDNIRWSERRAVHVCDYCWDSDRDDYGDDDDENEYMHEYSYKPKGIFHDTDDDEDGSTLYFGVENEMSHEDNYTRDEHSDYIYSRYDCNGRRESHFYQKSDSSLSHGIEIVSHPMSLSYWHGIYDHMDTVFRGSLDYTEGTEDGLHVHISRAGMTRTHERSFAMFAQFCRKGIETVARREDNSYSRFLKLQYMNDVYNGRCRSRFEDLLSDIRNERYSVVNWQNSRTVEVRAFRSTLNPVEFYACIEFCHAMYQFTKIHGPDTIWKLGIAKVLWDVFLNYCADDKRYSHMFDVLYKEAPLSLGSNCDDEDMLKNWWLTPFDRLDEFLEQDEELVSGSMVSLVGMTFDPRHRVYIDTDEWEPVPQPESVRTQQMAYEVTHSMYEDTYMMQWAEGWY